MKKRCALLLSKLIFEDKPITITELSTIFKVSPRTVRYDLDSIDSFLYSHGLPYLIRKPHLGVQFSPTAENRNRAMTLLAGMNNYQYVLSPEERKKLILIELLQSQNYVTIEKLSELLAVSRGTIVNDLKKVREWLNNQGLTLDTSRKYGIRINAEEKEIRRAAVALLAENMDFTNVLNMIKTPVHRQREEVVNQKFFKLLADIDISLIEDAVRMVEEQLEILFFEETFTGLVIHLALALKRIQLGKDIKMPKEELKKLSLTKEFAAASSLAKKLEDLFFIKIPVDEIGYITTYLLGGKLTKNKTSIKENWIKLQVLTLKIIENVQQETGYTFLHDEALYNGLLNHLEPALYRLTHSLPLKNPILEDIKRNYPFIFRAVQKGLHIMEDYFGFSVPDEEAGYIAIHFGAALERSKVKEKAVFRVLVVCGSGIGTANLLSSRLRSEFDNIEIVGTVACHRINEFIEQGNVHLIVSTVPTFNGRIPEILVSPFLPPRDINKIKSLLKDCPSSTKFEGQSTERPPLLNELLDVIGRHCKIYNPEQLVRDLSCALNIPETVAQKGVDLPVLTDLLTEKSIRLHVHARDWQEAVQIGGSILEENGIIEPRYTASMIQAVKELGPYMVIAPGIALPHAKPEAGAKSIGMSLITLVHPVNFGNPEYDPVNIVISLSAVDHITHLNALSELVELLEDENFLRLLREARSEKEIIMYLHAKSNKKSTV